MSLLDYGLDEKTNTFMSRAHEPSFIKKYTKKHVNDMKRIINITKNETLKADLIMISKSFRV